MATTLLGALVEHFQNDPGLEQAVPSGVWVGQTPETLPLPFVVIVHGGEQADWTFERDYLETGQVQFLCYAKGCAAAESIATLVKAAFDWVILSIANAVSIKVMRTNYLVQPEQQFRAPDGEIVYQAMVEYETEVRKTY